MDKSSKPGDNFTNCYNTLVHGRLERLTARLNPNQLEKRRKKIESRPISAFTFNRVRVVLEEPGMLWKTTSSVAQETGLPEYVTEDIIHTLSEEKDEILRSSHPDEETGEPCYTTRRHFDHTAPWPLKLKGILAGGID